MPYETLIPTKKSLTTIDSSSPMTGEIVFRAFKLISNLDADVEDAKTIIDISVAESLSNVVRLMKHWMLLF
jgi:hypothetical protein